MLRVNDIAGLNLEVSSRCNAKCPFCSRNKKVRQYGNHLLTLTDFRLLPKKLFDSLEWVSYAGNFGDPSTNPELPQISAYIKNLAPTVTLMGDTNGSVQNEEWWQSLGRSFADGTMFFALDGLEDSHAIHRKGTDFKRILRNVEAFSSAGGVAHWKFILFKHNESQVEKAEKLAEEIGCSRFFVVSSREYSSDCQKPENTSFDLKSEIFSAYQRKAISQDEEAVCKPYQNHSIYIAADGTVHPCCLAHCNFITEHEPSFEFIIDLIEKHFDQINFKTKPLNEILTGAYFTQVKQISKKNSYCRMKCNRHRKKALSKLILHDRYF